MKRPVTLPEQPTPMTFAERVEAIKGFRFTERQAGFLVTVMTPRRRLPRPPVLRVRAHHIRRAHADALPDAGSASVRTPQACATAARVCSMSITSRSTPPLASPTIAFDGP